MNDSHMPLDEVLKILTENPYISKLYIFGSRAARKDDDLSDIDLTAITPHPAAAETYTRRSLADKFSLSAIYTITNNEYEIARTFLPERYESVSQNWHRVFAARQNQFLSKFAADF